MEYPTNFIDQLKYWFWKVYTPLHPFVRDVSVYFGIVRHSVPRQNFLIGKLAPAYSPRETSLSLVKHGFGNHFVAWKDEGELVSLRRTVGFKYQYHVRIFDDGEVRCHYEYTPECHPIWHILEVDIAHRREDFMQLLHEFIVPVSQS